MAHTTILYNELVTDSDIYLVRKAVTDIIKKKFGTDKIQFVERNSLKEENPISIVVLVKAEAPDADYDSALKEALEQEAELAIREELPVWLNPEGTTMIRFEIKSREEEEESVLN